MEEPVYCEGTSPSASDLDRTVGERSNPSTRAEGNKSSNNTNSIAATDNSTISNNNITVNPPNTISFLPPYQPITNPMPNRQSLTLQELLKAINNPNSGLA
jgi:hypothetical protein